MDHPVERFASDNVCQAHPRDAGLGRSKAQPHAPHSQDRTADRAEILERLINPRGLGVAPARLVAVVDETLQEALDESPLVLWEAEEIIRFELPEARILLVLSEGAVAGQFGMTLAVVFEGETCHEIAPALARLIARTICLRYPHYETTADLGPFAQDLVIDRDIDAILAQPLSGVQPALQPVDMLIEQVWRSADARRPSPAPAPQASPQRPSAWARLLQLLTPPALVPMRQPVRILAFLLFGMGLIQGGSGLMAEAGTKAPSACSPTDQ